MMEIKKHYLMIQMDNSTTTILKKEVSSRHT